MMPSAGRSNGMTAYDSVCRAISEGLTAYEVSQLQVLFGTQDAHLGVDRCACAAGLLEGGDTLEQLLSRAGSEPKVFLVDYWEPYKSVAYRVDTQDDEERKQHAGRLLLYKQ